jgi:hypothetical protein
MEGLAICRRSVMSVDSHQVTMNEAILQVQFLRLQIILQPLGKGLGRNLRNSKFDQVQM